MVSFADDQQGLLVFTARFYRVCPYEHGLREFQAVVFLLNSFVVMNFLQTVSLKDSRVRFRCANLPASHVEKGETKQFPCVLWNV